LDGLVDFEEDSFGFFDFFRDHFSVPVVDVVGDFGVWGEVLGELVFGEEFGECLEDPEFHSGDAADVDECSLRSEEGFEGLEIFFEAVLDIEFFGLGWGEVS